MNIHFLLLTKKALKKKTEEDKALVSVNISLKISYADLYLRPKPQKSYIFVKKNSLYFNYQIPLQFHSDRFFWE